MNKRIDLTAIDTQITPIIHAVQYDTDRYIDCYFEDIDITGVSSARIYGLKPDGTEVYNDCVINDGYITAPLTSQTLAAVGTVKCQLQLVYNGTLTSFAFTVIVDESLVSSSAIESSNEYTALENALDEVQSVIDGLPSKVAKAGDTMTGDLNMSGNHIVGVNELVFDRDSDGNMPEILCNNSSDNIAIKNVATPQNDSWAANKKYVDDAIAAIPSITVDSALDNQSVNPVQNKVITNALDLKFDKAGGTISGAVTLNGALSMGGNLNMGNRQINNLAAPSYANSATRKQYVDDADALKEDVANKVTSINSSSTDTQYPSAKCVYDLIGDINTILANLATP